MKSSNNDMIQHYDLLIEENNDPVHDPKPLQDYMDKWDGQTFIDKMELDKDKSVLEIGVGTGKLAVKTALLCGEYGNGKVLFVFHAPNALQIRKSAPTLSSLFLRI